MTEDAQMKIRLPRDLKERIEAAATAANRSWNGEIVHRLESSFQGVIAPAPATSASALAEEVAGLKSQLRALRKQVGEIDTRTQHLLPAKKK